MLDGPGGWNTVCYPVDNGRPVEGTLRVRWTGLSARWIRDSGGGGLWAGKAATGCFAVLDSVERR